jgi:hypothetical protein
MQLNIVVLKLYVLSKLGGVEHEHVGDSKIHGEVLNMFSLGILDISFDLNKSVFDR